MRFAANLVHASLCSVAAPTGKTVSYTYDNVEGRRLSMALSTYGTWSYLYDNGGRLELCEFATSVTNPNTETTSYTYNRNNQITQVTNGNTTTANYAYNSRLFLTSLTNKYSNNNTLSSYTYTLDNVGNRTRTTEANGDYTDYTYDSAYQLTRDWKRNNQNNSIYDYSYTFDASGNRLTMVDNLTQTTTNYTYDSLNRMTAAGNITYGYDDNGNTLSKTVNAQTTNYTYSYENWLTQITYPNQSTNTFSYDGGGIRFSKTDTAGTTKYVRDGDSLIAELDGTNAMIAAYTNGPNGMVSQRRNNATKYHHFDGLGSTRQLTDANQTITDTYSFDAYGNITNQGGSSVNPAKYVGSLGYYADGDSGLLLLRHRYYDPTTGRFITLDPIKDGVNWYGYCGNNPVDHTDPSGLFDPIDDALIIVYAEFALWVVLDVGVNAWHGYHAVQEGRRVLVQWTGSITDELGNQVTGPEELELNKTQVIGYIQDANGGAWFVQWGGTGFIAMRALEVNGQYVPLPLLQSNGQGSAGMQYSTSP